MIASPFVPTPANPGAALPLGEAEFQQALQHAAHHRRLEAARSYLRALQLNPGLSQAAYNLGLLFQQMGQLPEAIGCYRHALQFHPGLAPAWGNLGVALRESGQTREAESSFRQALRCQPGDPEVLNHLGRLLLAEQQPDEAIACFREALRRAPAHPGLHLNLGDALRASGNVDQAIACFRRALQLQPDFAEAHWSLAFALLLQGDYTAGFAEYEWRWRRPDYPARPFAAPLWSGQSLAGRTLLVHTEQGAGDSLQFVRFVKCVAAQRARVILECQPPLVKLFHSVAGAQRVVPAGAALPPCDYHVPLLSLPHRLGVTLPTLPSDLAYLRPPAGSRAPWPPATTPARSPRKVGVAWRGNPRHSNDRQRSLPLSLLAPLFATPSVTFYSLQVPPAPELAGEARAIPGLIDLAGGLLDFADTAQAIMQLDLVISVDTSLAHLAGALGKPAWVLLPFAPDWRWLLHRKDSPWYPTLRLFRQPAPGDWASVVKQLGIALRSPSLSADAKVLARPADK